MSGSQEIFHDFEARLIWASKSNNQTASPVTTSKLQLN